MTGMSELRSTCFAATVRSASPFARAVRTKSCDSVSSIPARVMRMITGANVSASVSAGRTRWRTWPSGSSENSTYPVAGNQCEHEPEDEDEDGPDDERREHQPERGRAGDHEVERAARAARRERPQRDPRDDPEREGEGAELQRPRHAHGQLRPDRAPGEDRRAEVAPRQVPEPGAVLGEQRPVEPEGVPHRRDPVRGAAVLAEHHEHDVPRHRAEEEEHRRRDRHRHQDGGDHAAHEVRAHGRCAARLLSQPRPGQREPGVPPDRARRSARTLGCSSGRPRPGRPTRCTPTARARAPAR